MLALLLVAAGGLFAGLLALNAFLQTVRRQPVLRFTHTLLAFLTLLLPLAGLMLTSADAAPSAQVEGLTLVIAGLLIVFSLLVVLLELRRPERLRQSRGILGLGVGLLLGAATVTVPFTAAYTLLLTEPTASPTPAVAAAPTTAAALTDQEQARELFTAILDIVADETGLDRETIVTQLDAGVTMAQLVNDSGGDLDVVVSGISTIVREQIRALAAQGRINAAQAALAISQIENFIRIAVSRPWNDTGVAAFFRGSSIPTSEPAASTLAFTVTAPSATPTPTLTPTLTASATPTPSRTPRPTATPFPTRPGLATRTPVPTATLPNPCLALTNFNVNLRAEPTMDSAVLATIPFNTTVTLFGRDDSSTWWLASYAGQAGWLMGEFLRLTDSCADLPVR